MSNTPDSFPGCRPCLEQAIRLVLPAKSQSLADGRDVAVLIADEYAHQFSHGGE